MTRSEDAMKSDMLDLSEVLDNWAENSGIEGGGIDTLKKGGAELVATLAHLFDVHEEDFGEMLDTAAKQYVEEKAAVDPAFAARRREAEAYREVALKQLNLLTADEAIEALGLLGSSDIKGAMRS